MARGMTLTARASCSPTVARSVFGIQSDVRKSTSVVLKAIFPMTIPVSSGTFGWPARLHIALQLQKLHQTMKTNKGHNAAETASTRRSLRS
jgi:hypothetical protein